MAMRGSGSLDSMTTVRAFPFLRYDPDVTGPVGLLLAPPYDVIDADERERLAASAPYQSVHLELPAGGDAEMAGNLLRAWIAEGVLVGGDHGVAVVQQRFTGPDGVRRTRVGVACEVELTAFGEGGVLPHERTFDAPRRARAELMRATGANVSPVFLLYHDPELSLADLLVSVTDDEPDVVRTADDGSQVAAWYVTDPALCSQFEAAVAPHPLLIADGHHRYTAALEHQAASDSRLADSVLAIVANSADPGIQVFPTHRIVGGVDPRLLDEFVVGSGALGEQAFDDVPAALAALDALGVPGIVVVGGVGRGPRLLSVPEASDLELAAPGTSEAYRRLDVVALHALILDGGAVLATQASGGVHYTRSLDEALERVGESPGDTLAFLTRGAAVEDVHALAAAGELLPQKSTYFFPKLPTGVAFRSLDPALLPA